MGENDGIGPGCRKRGRDNTDRGHAGHEENERCDVLATGAADGADLAEDEAYVQGHTKITSSLFDEND